MIDKRAVAPCGHHTYDGHENDCDGYDPVAYDHLVEELVEAADWVRTFLGSPELDDALAILNNILGKFGRNRPEGGPA